MRRGNAAAGVATILVAMAGCMSQPNARYIYQDGEFGVVGIPQNSPFGSRDYGKQARELMDQHFPDGYEIVRAEEVVEGQRVLDKSRKAEFETDPAFNALNQKINLGKLARTESTQQKDSLPILESRIIYKRRTTGEPRGVNGFAATAKAIPEFYLDPNEMARCRERIELADLKTRKGVAVAEADKPKEKDKEKDKTIDPAAQKASHDPSK